MGSHVCAWLLDAGHQVGIIDNLSTGRPELLLSKNFTHASVGNKIAVEKVLKQNAFDCVMHLAARAIVAESFEKPDEYFENNFRQTELLLETLLEHGVHKFIFSSSCTIFGNSKADPIDELQPKSPMSPYGESKLRAENLLEEWALNKGLECIVLRYFNAAGSEPSGRTGEWHHPETRLIPLALKAAREQSPFHILGNDYPTPDGTCIRDYVHVWDIARGHSQAMNRLLKEKVQFETYHLGTEKGFSVKEILASVEEITGLKINKIVKPQRKGDPAKLVASAQKAQKILDFQTPHSSLENMIRSAWNWQKRLN